MYVTSSGGGRRENLPLLAVKNLRGFFALLGPVRIGGIAEHDVYDYATSGGDTQYFANLGFVYPTYDVATDTFSRGSKRDVCGSYAEIDIGIVDFFHFSADSSREVGFLLYYYDVYGILTCEMIHTQ